MGARGRPGPHNAASPAHRSSRPPSTSAPACLPLAGPARLGLRGCRRALLPNPPLGGFRSHTYRPPHPEGQKAVLTVACGSHLQAPRPRLAPLLASSPSFPGPSAHSLPHVARGPPPHLRAPPHLSLLQGPSCLPTHPAALGLNHSTPPPQPPRAGLPALLRFNQSSHTVLPF